MTTKAFQCWIVSKPAFHLPYLC